MLSYIRRGRLTRLQAAADKARDGRDWKQAAKLYKRALGVDRRNVPLWIQLGHARKESGEWDEAEAAYREAVTAAPTDADAHLQLGRLLCLLAEFVGSYEALARAATCSERVEPLSERLQIQSNIYIALGDLARSQKQWGVAADHYKAALDRVPEDGRLWVQYGHALKENGAWDLSETAYRKALQFSDCDSDVHAHLADVVTKKLGQTRHELEATRAALAGAEAKLARERSERDRLIEVRQELEAKAASMESSLSWRITRPMRAVGSLIERSSSRINLRNGVVARGQREFVDALGNSPPNQHRIGLMEARSRSDFYDRMQLAHRRGEPTFVMLPAIDWNVTLFQRPQHMAMAMARHGALTVYLTYEDLGAPCRTLSDNCWLVNCYIDLDAELIAQLKGTIISFYSTAWFNKPDILSSLGTQNKLIYEYIDHVDEAISGEHVGKLTTLKNFAFDGGADLIAASAKALEDEAVSRVGRNRVALVPNGTDYEHYKAALRRTNEVPENMRRLGQGHKAIVGYFGALAPWIWHEMLNELTARRPDLGFVLIGPDYHGGMSKIERRDNVLITGPIPYPQLPKYAKSFDAAIIPFRHGEIARTTSPLKLFEYFSLEKPVVVTNQMKECTIYPEVFRAAEVQSFSAELDIAIKKGRSRHFRTKLRKLALANTWDVRARDLLNAGVKIEKSAGEAT